MLSSIIVRIWPKMISKNFDPENVQFCGTCLSSELVAQAVLMENILDEILCTNATSHKFLILLLVMLAMFWNQS